MVAVIGFLPDVAAWYRAACELSLILVSVTSERFGSEASRFDAAPTVVLTLRFTDQCIDVMSIQPTWSLCVASPVIVWSPPTRFRYMGMM